MSEIGPMRVSSRLRCRMSSCANANGIDGSSAQPIAMDMPSRTCRATASRSVARLSFKRVAAARPPGYASRPASSDSLVADEPLLAHLLQAKRVAAARPPGYASRPASSDSLVADEPLLAHLLQAKR